MNPRVSAVSIMAVSVELPFKKPAEKMHITMLCFTTLGSNASGYWHSSMYGGVLGKVPFLFTASVANTSLYKNKPPPKLGPKRYKQSVYETLILVVVDLRTGSEQDGLEWVIN